MNKVVIKILQGSVVALTLLGGLIIYSVHVVIIMKVGWQ